MWLTAVLYDSHTPHGCPVTNKGNYYFNVNPILKKKYTVCISLQINSCHVMLILLSFWLRV